MKSNNLKKAWNDLTTSIYFWRIFGLIGINDIRKRYKRSKLGQLWLTISTCINIGAMAIVWGLLFKIPVKEYLPFIAVGQIFWIYISSCVIEGATAYISAEHYLKELKIPKISYINSLFVRNSVVLLHNVVVLIPIYLFCTAFSWYAIISLLGFILTTLFIFGVVLSISIISLRFRDFPNIVSSLMQVVFYVTPVLWKPDLMPEKIQKLIVFNPFAVFLSICRNPLLGINISYEYWVISIMYAISALIFAFFLFSKFRARIVYWL